MIKYFLNHNGRQAEVFVGLRKSVPVSALLLCLGLVAEEAVGQTSLVKYAPEVTGAVVDNSPFSYGGNGDWVESGMLIGNINNQIRKAILEFNISGITPGVVDRARITGQIGPNNSAPSGTRSHFFAIAPGDGVLTIQDNNQSTGISAGSVSHTAGGTSTYDQDITLLYRGVTYSGADYLMQRIRPGGAEQGWDAVYSFLPPPQLELDIRPTTASTTVYYERPVDWGMAHAENGGAFTVTNNTAAEVMNWPYSPYEQGRGLMEFDLSSIPDNAKILWAKVETYVSGLQGSLGSPGPELQLMGFAGDGTVDNNDVVVAGTLLGTTDPIGSTGAQIWELDPETLEGLLGGNDHLGLRIEPGGSPELRVRFDLYESNPTVAYQNPSLAIAYEIVPEPGTLAGIAVMGVLLTTRRRRDHRTW